MRRLLNTLFVLTEDAYLALENENVVVKQGEKVLGRVPLLTLESIIDFSWRGAIMGPLSRPLVKILSVSSDELS